MAYVSVELDVDQVLPEFDASEIIEYVYYNIDNNQLFSQYDYDDIREYLVKEIGDILIEDTDTLADLLDPTANPALLKEFIQEIYEKQRGKQH